MSLKKLKKLVGKGKDLEQLFETFRNDRDDRDPMVFARWLHDRGYLNADQLRDYLLAGDVSFTISEAAEHVRSVPTSRYDLLGMIGRGAMGEVHVARDRDLNRNVAVKLMDPGLAADPRLARRFYTEAQVTAQLDHPAIVPVFGVERSMDGTLGYAMRIVRGRTLKDYLVETRAFYEKKQRPDDAHSLQARLLVFEDLCNAMAYAHARGVVHRDLKPDNIMVGPYGEVLVMDWGIAKIIGGPKDAVSDLPKGVIAEDGTAVGDAIGTPKYMSPEQAEGRNDELDGRSDQYALGLLLFEIVALKQANPGTNAMTSWGAACAGKMAPFTHAFGEAIPKDLAVIVAKATTWERGARYADVAQLAEDVRRFLGDEELIARKDGLGQRVNRAISRHRRAVALTIAALAALVVVVASGSIAIGAAALTGYAWYADAREERLGEVLASVSEQGHALDGAFAAYAGEVRGLRAAAELAFRDDAPVDQPVYFAEQFHDPATAPTDMVDSAVYEAKATLTYPDFAAAASVDREALRPRLLQLASLQPQMLGMLARSVSPALADAPHEEKVRALLQDGAPMIWAYVATTEGVLAGLPGVGDYPDDYDPRDQAWYKTGFAAVDIGWEVDVDESGQGLLLTAVTPVHGPDGARLGVAALDIGVKHVTDALLRPEGLPITEALLLDPEGRVLVSTLDAHAPETKPPFRHPEIAERIAAGQTSAWLELGPELVVWTRVDQLGWTYVVVGETSVLVDVLSD